MRYVMYFRFCGWRHVFIWWRKYALIKDDVYVWSRSPGGGTGGEVCHLRLHIIQAVLLHKSVNTNYEPSLARAGTLRDRRYVPSLPIGQWVAGGSTVEVVPTVYSQQYGGRGVSDLVARVTDVLTTVSWTDRRQWQTTTEVDNWSVRRQRATVTSCPV